MKLWILMFLGWIDKHLPLWALVLFFKPAAQSRAALAMHLRDMGLSPHTARCVTLRYLVEMGPLSRYFWVTAM